MSVSNWLLATDTRRPGSVIHHYIPDARLKDLGITGRIGDEYRLFPDDCRKYRVVGKIDGDAVRFLDAAVQLIDAASFDAGGASQGLRYNIIEGIVRSVMRAAKRARESENV